MASAIRMLSRAFSFGARRSAPTAVPSMGSIRRRKITSLSWNPASVSTGSFDVEGSWSTLYRATLTIRAAGQWLRAESGNDERYWRSIIWRENDCFQVVITGLDPVIHLFRMMDTRVKPAYDK